jgi:hypothetical protein
MSNVVSISQNNRIAGTWKHCDGFSDKEFTFTVRNSEVQVSVVDTSDGEIPEIYGVGWNERELALSFVVHWSTGHLMKYRVCVGPNADRIQATITTTFQELWERQ